MVNFRFHIVSLTAVFLAIAIGIAVGATVVDRATVDALKNRLDAVERRVDRTDGENARLQHELGTWARFADEAGAEAVAGRLQDVPVLVIGVQGIRREPVDELRGSLAAADARLLGTLWLTSRFKLEKAEDVTALAAIVGNMQRSADAIRRAAVSRLAAALAGAESSSLLVALRDAAFVEYDPPEGRVVDLSAVPLPGTLFVVMSSFEPDVPNDQLAVPLAAQLARVAGARVLAAEAGQEASGRRPAQRAAFVGPLRQDPAVTGLLSTVDNVEDFRGRFAAVYALRDLLRGKVGHFGLGPGVSGPVPQSVS
ncbi:MAG TPA: copper transporter [Acidimicrobiales bacterium]|nr:copper transporter [Acidimicrobiales bacterium]